MFNDNVVERDVVNLLFHLYWHLLRDHLMKLKPIMIRKAKKNDTHFILGLRNRAIFGKCTGFYPDEHLRTWTSGQLSEVLVHQVERSYYVALFGEEIVGIGILNLQRSFIDGLFVEPRYMGLGVGKYLLSHMEILASHAGHHEIKLHSTVNAMTFYGRRGFVKADNEYPTEEVRLNQIPMVKQLPVQNSTNEQSYAVN